VKIAILCHMHHPIAEPYEGGTEAHTAILADELVARGHEVTLFAKEGSVSRAKIHPLVPSDFEFIRVASPRVRAQQRGFLAEAVHHSIGIIESADYDVVINNSLSSLPYVNLQSSAMLTILHTPPTLADVTAVVTDRGWVPGARHAWVTVSESNARGWSALLPDVRTVYNGIRLEEWRATSRVTPGRAVWSGRITPEKGLHLAIDAARAAGLSLEFAGPVSHEDYFQAEIEHRLGSDVVYRGHLAHDELRNLMSSGAVFISSPLWAEPFGLSAVEALAAGTPVAAFANGALPEIITQLNGALAWENSVEALAGAVRSAVTRDRVETAQSSERFDFRKMVDRYEEIMTALVEPRATSDALAGTDGLPATELVPAV
jgi:glycosyltransferase involved in cell wall biosynthesis